MPPVTAVLFFPPDGGSVGGVMTTYLTYGAAIAIAHALLTFALYFLGYHSDPAKIQTAGYLATLFSIIITITFLVLGTKARRAQVPAAEDFTYGRALGAAFMITLFAAIFGTIPTAVYFGVINPGYADVVIESQRAQWEAQNLPPEAQEMAEKWTRWMMGTGAMTVIGFFATLVWGTLIGLVTSAFLKRPATIEPPALG